MISRSERHSDTHALSRLLARLEIRASAWDATRRPLQSGGVDQKVSVFSRLSPSTTNRVQDLARSATHVASCTRSWYALSCHCVSLYMLTRSSSRSGCRTTNAITLPQRMLGHRRRADASTKVATTDQTTRTILAPKPVDFNRSPTSPNSFDDSL